MADLKQKTTWQKVRKLFQDIHLWLGLSSGLIIIAVCLSGTIYVFNTELTEMWAPHLYKVQPATADPIPAENLLDKITKESGGQVTTLSIYSDAGRTYQFNTKTKGDKSRSGTAYFVNPYTGEITGNSNEKNSMKDFMSSMFSLHRWLLLDKIEKPLFTGISNRELGSKITGWATIIFTLGCITGLIIWFPKKIKNWRQGLKIKTSGNWKRINHDLHNSLAFYSLIFLLLMGLTGPQWSFDWYRTGLQKSLGAYKSPTEKAVKKNTSPAGANIESKNPELPASKNNLSLAAYINSANAILPYKGDYRIILPEAGENTISLNKTRTGFFAPAAADKIVINTITGEVIKTDIFSNKPINERIAGSIKAIHVGNAYGTFTKLLYFLACLIATSLPITGTLIWLNKLKKRRKRKAFNVRIEKEIGSEEMVMN